MAIVQASMANGLRLQRANGMDAGHMYTADAAYEQSVAAVLAAVKCRSLRGAETFAVSVRASML